MHDDVDAATAQDGPRSVPREAFDLGDLVTLKVAAGTTVSVCIPARDEARTVGAVVSAIRGALMVDQTSAGQALVDEIVVVDDHSRDDTARAASAAGARVIDARTTLTDHGLGHGKGEALWKSLHGSSGDLVVWVDADIVDFDPSFVIGLLGPLLTDPQVDFVKGHYQRPEVDGAGGGRVTELLARPLLAQYFPDLGQFAQPLAGEYAGRRRLLERLPFVVGYGVDIALLIDASTTAGVEHLAQVDLGVRHHRNRPLAELGPQALAVSQAILERAGVRPPGPAVLLRPGHESLSLALHERPPLVSLVDR